MRRVGGIIYVKVDGTVYQAKGDYTYNFGSPKRETILGVDGPHGVKETPQASFIEGEITDASDLDVKAFTELIDSTVTIELNNGKTIALKEAAYTADGDINTGEGNIQVRFEGSGMTEV